MIQRDILPSAREKAKQQGILSRALTHDGSARLTQQPFAHRRVVDLATAGLLTTASSESIERQCNDARIRIRMCCLARVLLTTVQKCRASPIA